MYSGSCSERPAGLGKYVGFWRRRHFVSVGPLQSALAIHHHGGDRLQFWYNSLQVVATKRISHGFQFQGNYTWSKLLDDGTGEQSSDGSWWATDSGYPYLARGLASYNVTHNFRFNTIYFFPKISEGGIIGGIANGWRVSSIISLQTGYPFSPALGSNRSESGVLTNNADLPNLAPGRNASNITSGVSTSNGISPCPTAGQPLGTPTLYYDPCAFVDQPFGYLGNEPRNYLTGPGLADVDFSLVKDTPLKSLGEAGVVEFRAEIFNLFNHPNFGMPGASAVYTVLNGTSTTLASGSTTQWVEAPVSSAGVIKATSGTSRQIQFALRISF